MEAIISKKYVTTTDSTIDPFLNKHFKVGRKVIVVDGSYMVNENGNPVSGCDFYTEKQHELLTITRINIPFETDYRGGSDVLGYHNNCEIQGYDGKKYYCSHINILVFSK